MRKTHNMLKSLLFIATALTLAFAKTGVTEAQENASGPALTSPVLEDTNGDSAIVLLGFGDSITYGVGDGTAPGAFVSDVPETNGTQGYLPRLSSLLGVPVLNGGVPGEQLSPSGTARFPSFAGNAGEDTILFLEGANDANQILDAGVYKRLVQKAINVAKVLGKNFVVFTLPTPCCEHASLAPFTNSYSQQIRDIARVNQLVMVDLERAWKTTCEGNDGCTLYNLPEGLHPNTKGYTVVAQTTAAAILGIDIFALDGAALLEQALGLAPGTVVVKPGV